MIDVFRNAANPPCEPFAWRRAAGSRVRARIMALGASKVGMLSHEPFDVAAELPGLVRPEGVLRRRRQLDDVDPVGQEEGLGTGRASDDQDVVGRVGGRESCSKLAASTEMAKPVRIVAVQQEPGHLQLRIVAEGVMSIAPSWGYSRRGRQWTNMLRPGVRLVTTVLRPWSYCVVLVKPPKLPRGSPTQCGETTE